MVSIAESITMRWLSEAKAVTSRLFSVYVWQFDVSEEKGARQRYRCEASTKAESDATLVSNI